MLDTETKRRIDTARDILVGKVPDPKSQVEQITLALIYKFMDDMDKESLGLGGEATFFRGEFAKYGWSAIFDPRLNGHEVLNLYSEAMAKLNQNPSIPPLFREIFKNAYLPYRDPETLKLFLKTISEFQYDHSEKLGDAFEYLLSVLGSQGEAGQFRTPRHIIDFIVTVLQPLKTETILDPACGTAGFLIASYKYIVAQNTKTGTGDLLSSSDRKRLMQNLVGYDISPDMVRLSLVNMYLHGFVTPKIYEYDTLTSEERWGEDNFDIILANPPFMTPKGGIKPHQKFSLQANRSEVLFVDYIAEHLHPLKGRAGVIVPEGIIFQSGKAYKQLRKMLVEKYLYAVVSLPAGIFQPYSGVKTSILLLNAALAKRSESILFVKIENDGFDLGAQRRSIEKNDLPAAVELLKHYESTLTVAEEAFSSLSVVVASKVKIAENGDYNLSGERYRIRHDLRVSAYEMRKVEDLLENVKYTNKIPKSEFLNFGKFPIVDQSEKFISGYWNNEEDVFKITKPVIIFGDHTRIFKFVDFDFVLGADGVKVLQPKEIIEPKFFYFCLMTLDLRNLGYSRHYKELKEHKIPLPPLEIQQAIVAKIENYQAIINGAKQVVENYRPQIEVAPEWEMVGLGNMEVEIIDGDRGENYPKKEDFKTQGFCLFLNTKNVRKDGFLFDELDFISQEKDQELRKGKLQRGDVVLTTRGTLGNVGCYDSIVPYENVRINSGMIILRPNNEYINSRYLFNLIRSEFIRRQFFSLSSGSAQPQLPIRNLVSLQIPIPPLPVQQEIVARIEKEQSLVNANRELIALFEQKIKEEIEKVYSGANE